jgi:tetratricopeptide (TPR) repeat protein
MVHEPTQTPLKLTVDRTNDVLLAIAHGHVVDGKQEDEYIRLTEQVALLLADPEGDLIGFVVDGISGLEPGEGPEELWETPDFHVPEIGLRNANAGEILTAGLAAYPGSSTLDAELFHQAVNNQDDAEIEDYWRLCLGAGDLKAHFGLGYTLCELGRHREAYAHLRYYTELVPRNAWAWCWLGHACAGAGERAEAILAYEQALELERKGSFETDAAECLGNLGVRSAGRSTSDEDVQ